MEKVKRRNRLLIVNFIHETGPVSRKSMSETLGLTPAAVTQICTELMDRGVLIETGTLPGEKKAGRKRVLVDIDYNYRYVYGINIFPENIILVLTNLNGEVLERAEIDPVLERSTEELIDQMAEECRKMRKLQEVGLEMMAGIGISICQFDAETGHSSRYGKREWDEDLLRMKISAMSGLPVEIGDSVKALTMAEQFYGHGRQRDNMFLVHWDKWLWSSCVTENKIYTDHVKKPVGLEHLIIQKSGAKCCCGRRGCLETVLTFQNIRRHIQELFDDGQTPLLSDRIDGDFANFSFELLIGSWDEMDEVIRLYLGDILDVFARTLINATTLLAPESIVLSGRWFKNERTFNSLIRAASYYDEAYDSKRLIYTRLSDREDYIGAVALITGADLYDFLY